MTAKSALNTPYNSKAVIIIDDMDRVCVIEKEKYNNSYPNTGEWSGSMQVLGEDKALFHGCASIYTPAELKQSFSPAQIEAIQEAIKIVENFKTY